MSTRYRIFLSSVQKELAEERQALKTFIGLRPPEFRQDVGLFVQTLWRSVQAGLTEENVTAQVGTKLAPSRISL